MNKEHIDQRFVNKVFIFGEIFIPKKLNFFQKFIIWCKWKVREHQIRKEAYRHALETKYRNYCIDDYLEVKNNYEKNYGKVP